MTKPLATHWQQPQALLLSMTFVMSFGFAVWQVLLNNFVIEKAAFTGVEIGLLQSFREVPGFLAFTAVFVLLLLKEQTFLFVALLLMLVGVAITGFLPFEFGLYATTVLMSTGFHYFETLNKSLTLQWLDKAGTAHFLGRALAVKAAASLGAYALIWLAMEALGVDYRWMYFTVGAAGVLVTLLLWWRFNDFSGGTVQHKKLLLRRRYWLYYTLVFLSGARRQIFIVFAGFMMVEKFHYSVGDISALFIINYLFNFFFAAKIGKFIGVVGERRALIFEYLGLIAIFSGYALVSNAYIAAGLYVLDHLFFALAIAITTYFQKIANPADMAATSSVSFTINHIAAVVIPALLGIVWIASPGAVFMVGTGFAVLSLLCALNVPSAPSETRATAWAFGKPALPD